MVFGNSTDPREKVQCEKGRFDFGRFLLASVERVSVKALAGPCRTEPTIVTEVGLRRITIFGTGFYNLIKSEVNIDEL